MVSKSYQPLGNNLCYYSDADFASNDDRVSVSGALHFLNNNLVSWNSSKQRSVATSTCESELNALRGVVLANMAARDFLNELGLGNKAATKVYVDNAAAIDVANGSSHSSTLKHVLVSIAKIREQVREKNVTLRFVNSRSNLADLMTKPLKKVRFQLLRDAIMKQSTESLYQCAARCRRIS